MVSINTATRHPERADHSVARCLVESEERVLVCGESQRERGEREHPPPVPSVLVELVTSLASPYEGHNLSQGRR